MVSLSDCRCSEIQFCAFVEKHSNFGYDQQMQLKAQILNPHLSATLYVVITLTFWTVIGSIIDFFIIPLFITLTWFSTDTVEYAVLVPLVFMAANIVAKYGYLQYKLGCIKPWYTLVVASLPYVGPMYLLHNVIKRNTLLKEAVIEYARFKKTNFKIRLFTITKR